MDMVWVLILKSALYFPILIWLLFLLLEFLRVHKLILPRAIGKLTFTCNRKLSKVLIDWSVLSGILSVYLISDQILVLVFNKVFMIWTSDRIRKNLWEFGLLSCRLVALLSVSMIHYQISVTNRILNWSPIHNIGLRRVKGPGLIRAMIIMVDNNMFGQIFTVHNVILTALIL